MTKVTVLIPTRNEVKTIGLLIDEIKSLPFEAIILVADYKSTDGTRELVISKSVRVLDVKEKGKGSAVREALRHIDTEYTICIDADLTYPSSFIEDIYLLLEDKLDGVLGIRKDKFSGAMSKVHSSGNFGLSLLLSILFWRGFTDINTGLWGYRTDLLKKFNLVSKEFTIEVDLLTNALLKGLKIVEFPIVYGARLDGTSPKLKFTDGFKIAWFIIRRRFGLV